MVIILSQECRPQTFKQVAGQSLPKEILKAIVKNPNSSPRSIILQGGFGCGKTTMARALSKALNCPNQTNYDACGKPDCPICSQDLSNSSFYTEYDSSIVGNVEKIRELRDTFYYTVPGQYKVIVFDEIQEASSRAQGALLKSIEEAPSGIFFVFCTTHINKVIPTIVSRSLEIEVTTVSITDIVTNLKSISDKNNIDIDEDMLKIIAHKSKGHMRNAHMLLDTYSLLGKEKFIESVKSSREYILNYLVAVYQKDKNKLFKSIDNLQTYPVANLYNDFNELLLTLVTKLFNQDDTPESKVAKLYGPNLLKFVRLFASEWVQNSFKNDLMFQTCLLSLYQLFTVNQQSSKQIRTK